MTRTVVPFPTRPAEPGAPGLALLDAARTWRRAPGCDSPFPPSTVRRLGASGLLGALSGLDTLMAVLTVHSDDPIALGQPGDDPTGPDSRLLGALLDQAVCEGRVDDRLLERLSERVAPAARPLLRKALDTLIRAAWPRVLRCALPGVWHGADPVASWDSDSDADSMDNAMIAPLATAYHLAAE
ncbi:hypothetical protein F1188_19795 [Roseospira marina]|uniref:Uncharacterized protein n=1 Tax=Roseospira marina TaxID=140057 RepID=A0A5M6I4V5_9PROT|nr:hypothetical protein [Roseospira marina]KAA5603260.1 hypothetical protein F1188_19795 [Roseospira marina]MBB4316160.1 hypothetical protein [Roseospira marina]MBB5089364.1 hypothetical protein [Roseospira marina]